MTCAATLPASAPNAESRFPQAAVDPPRCNRIPARCSSAKRKSVPHKHLHQYLKLLKNLLDIPQSRDIILMLANLATQAGGWFSGFVRSPQERSVAGSGTNW